MDGAGRNGQGPNTREICAQEITFRNEFLVERQCERLSTETRGRRQRRYGVTAFARRKRKQEERFRSEGMKWKVLIAPGRRQQRVEDQRQIPFGDSKGRHRLCVAKALHELRKEGVAARIKPRNQTNDMPYCRTVSCQGADGRTPGGSDVCQEIGDCRRRRLEGIQVTRGAKVCKQTPARFISGVGAGKTRATQLPQGVVAVSQVSKSGQRMAHSAKDRRVGSAIL